MKKKQILEIPQVVEIVFGQGYHFKGSKKEFFADGGISILVNRNNKLSGVIGFDFEQGVLAVVQMQGFRRGNFHDGMLPGEYLLPIAEQIARLLGVEKIAVQAAQYHVNFNTKKAHQSELWLLAKKERMLANYNEVCKARGYIEILPAAQWWVKKL